MGRSHTWQIRRSEERLIRQPVYPKPSTTASTTAAPTQTPLRSTAAPPLRSYNRRHSRESRGTFGVPRLLRQSDMLDPLREEVLDANRELVRRGLVLYTFGNAS